MISRLSEAQYLEHINFEEEIEKFKGTIDENLTEKSGVRLPIMVLSKLLHAILLNDNREDALHFRPPFSSIWKEQYPNYIHVYLTVRDLKTGNRAEFVNKSDIINYINEKVFEGRDENYMVLEAYAGKYSIWLSNKEAAQGKV